jgi:hypothetical protein
METKDAIKNEIADYLEKLSKKIREDDIVFADFYLDNLINEIMHKIYNEIYDFPFPFYEMRDIACVMFLMHLRENALHLLRMNS